MTTPVLGRLLIHLQRTECRPTSPPLLPQYDLRLGRCVISPFGLVKLNRKTSSGSAHSGGYWDGDADTDAAAGHARASSADNPLEITQIPLWYPYH